MHHKLKISRNDLMLIRREIMKGLQYSTFSISWVHRAIFIQLWFCFHFYQFWEKADNPSPPLSHQCFLQLPKKGFQNTSVRPYHASTTMRGFGIRKRSLHLCSLQKARTCIINFHYSEFPECGFAFILTCYWENHKYETVACIMFWVGLTL